MLIVIPSLIILFAAIIIVYLVKIAVPRRDEDEEKEKHVVREKRLYRKDKEYSNEENKPVYRENKPEPECC